MDGTAGADEGNAYVAADSSTASKVIDMDKKHTSLNLLHN